VPQGSDGLLPDADSNSPKRSGPPAKPHAQAKVAAEMGVSRSRLMMASQHVSAMARYPELDTPDLSQLEATRLATDWDAMSQRQRAFARKKWAKGRTVQEMPAPDTEQAPQAAAVKVRQLKTRKRRRRPKPTVAMPPTRPWYYFSAGLLQVITDFEHTGGVEAMLAIWRDEERQQALKELVDRLSQLTRIQDALLSTRRVGPLQLITGRS